MAHTHTLTLPHLSDFPVHLALFTSVTNAAYLRSQLLAGNAEFEYAFLDATTLLSPIHIQTAVFRAINDLQNSRLKSRNVHSEIVFDLSPTNNIADSFRRFGIQDGTTHLLAVKVSAPYSPCTAAEVQEFLTQQVQGNPVPFESLGENADWAAIRKVYKLTPPNNAKSNRPKTNGVDAKGLSDEEKREAEIVIMGLIALKGS